MGGPILAPCTVYNKNIVVHDPDSEGFGKTMDFNSGRLLMVQINDSKLKKIESAEWANFFSINMSDKPKFCFKCQKQLVSCCFMYLPSYQIK